MDTLKVIAWKKDIPFRDNQKKTDVAMLISNQSSEQEALPGIEILQVITVLNMYSPYNII